MRFEALTIENYGRTKEVALRFAASPGLNVIFGANESGKSTALEAVADLLFGVPDRSERGQIFGADQIRLNASLALADGTRLFLKRRKGRGRTLTDDAGQPIDEAALGKILGATGRERFRSLFGLGHEALRRGGDDLLKADGDIGRLILEAGGGLRSLVETVDGLRAQASELFDARKSKDRLFYVGLRAFEEADGAVKRSVMTREHYVKAKQQLNSARAVVEQRRQQLSALTEEKLRLARVVRVAPAIREFDRLEERLAAFADVAPLGDDFAGCCDAALETHQRREEALREAKSRCKTLQAKIEALAPDQNLIAAESLIRDAREKATHVSKARQDRANRETELAAFSENLRVLRLAIGVSSDRELEAAAPSAEAIKTAQNLAAKGFERRGKLASLDAELQRETKTREAILARQSERRASGRHEPFGVDAASFSVLPELTARLEAERLRLAAEETDIMAATLQQGFDSVAALRSWICPDAAAIQCEIDRRAAIEAESGRILEKIKAETERRDRASAVAEHLTAGADAPTAEAIATARRDRDLVWDEIKARYLDLETAAKRSFAERLADVALKEKRARAADDLADRKSSDAERVAALDLARRDRSAAGCALDALAREREALEKRRAAAESAWRCAWPEACSRVDDLGRLKLAAAERAALLARRDQWRAQSDVLATEAAEIAPRLAALEQAETRFELPPGATLAERAAAAIRALKAHEDAYADYRQDEAALRDGALKLGRIADEHAKLVAAEAEWRSLWGPAVKALRLSETAEIEQASDVANLWAAAAGQFEGLRITRNRLKRMDDDETDLRGLARTIAASMDFSLPADAAAAVKMLAERLDGARKMMIERDSLLSQLSALLVERDDSARAAAMSRAAIETLCARTGATPAELPGLAARCRERSGVAERREALAASIVQVGDGLSIASLRESWGGRDLDEIRAKAEQLDGEARHLAASLEEALAAQQDRNREFEALMAFEGVNAAVAERERAVAEMHNALERYVELALAEDLLRAAMDKLRDERQDPLILRAGELFAAATAGAFAGVDTDVDAAGVPVVVGRRSGGEEVPVKLMSDGVRDQLYLAFRIASIEHYAKAAEPLPFVADDLLVHFDDERGAEALGLLAELGRSTQVLLFTHHRSLKEASAPLVAQNRAAILELAPR
jgi:uncharacterized protein YhaN